MDKKRTGFWQWVKNILKKRPFLCSWIVFLLLFFFTNDQNIRPIDNFLFLVLVFIPYFFIYIFTPFVFIKDKRKFSVKFHAADKWKWFIIIVFSIGLPLIGIVAYNGMTTAAKINAAKTNHAQSVKYISAEIQYCNLGESKFMNGTQDCPATAKKAINGAIARLTNKNPYSIKNNAVRISTSNTNDEDVGYISLSASESDIIIKTCNKTPCNKEANRQSSTVSIK